MLRAKRSGVLAKRPRNANMWLAHSKTVMYGLGIPYKKIALRVCE